MAIDFSLVDLAVDRGHRPIMLMNDMACCVYCGAPATENMPECRRPQVEIYAKRATLQLAKLDSDGKGTFARRVPELDYLASQGLVSVRQVGGAFEYAIIGG